MAIIYLIRHGQASFLKSNYDQLSETGVDQSGELGSALQQRKAMPSFLESGTMVRHQDTAKHCMQSYGKEFDLIKNDGWNEYNHREIIAKHNPKFEDFDELKKHILSQEDPMAALQEILSQSIKEWMSDEHEYSTSWMNFQENVWSQLTRLAANLSKGEKAWVFTSGGPISVIVMKLLQLEEVQFPMLQDKLVNTSVTKILIGKSGLSLSTYNDYSHLEHNHQWITYR